ncbi:hypothetical protein [Alteribacillus sp. HJP-4]|uniref:hypothetical protein n=1 Tax=Alteribacillus sp. HJP-4 TaxID=2775394 RepID=UPI0035CD26D2
MEKQYAYFHDASQRQVTVGTKEDIEKLNRDNHEIVYCATQTELVSNVREFYKREWIVTLATRLKTFEEELFMT